MLLAGDEMGRSQQGNNNAWCQDNALSWIDWNSLEKNRSLFSFFRHLIAFRQQHALLRPRHFEGKESGERCLTWHGFSLHKPDWTETSQSLAMHLQGTVDEAEIYLIAHASTKAADFALPEADSNRPWRRFVDTALPVEDSSCSPGDEAVLQNQKSYRLEGQSVVVLIR
jgi:glycogen operon protein